MTNSSSISLFLSQYRTGIVSATLSQARDFKIAKVLCDDMDSLAITVVWVVIRRISEDHTPHGVAFAAYRRAV